MPAIDTYAALVPTAAGPAQRIFPIAPTDTEDLPFVTTGIQVGGAGVVVVVDRESGVSVPIAVVDGQLLPVRVARVMATGTTATGLVGYA